VDAISARCSGSNSSSNSRPFTSGGVGGNPVANPDCPEGFTGADVFYRDDNDGINQIYFRCNDSSWGSPIGSRDDAITFFPFECTPRTRIVAVSGNTLTYLHNIAFTCDGVSPPTSPTGYNLVEALPLCAVTSNANYATCPQSFCPDPPHGLDFEDIYMVSVLPVGCDYIFSFLDEVSLTAGPQQVCWHVDNSFCLLSFFVQGYYARLMQTLVNAIRMDPQGFINVYQPRTTTSDFACNISQLLIPLR